MSEYHVLSSFTPDDSAIVRSRITRENLLFKVDFQVTAKDAGLNWPKPAGARRVTRLWEGTCLEVFIAPATGNAYWEFNVSPQGGWNVFSFERYRYPVTREDEAFTDLKISADSELSKYGVSWEFDLASCCDPKDEFAVGLSAILSFDSGKRVYYALAHPSHQPDFHDRESFRLCV